MSKGFGAFGDVLKQAQEMQQRMTEIQEEAGKKTVEATSGGGMVKAVVNGKMEVVSLEIDPIAADGGDREMLQDLIIAAVNQGIKNAQAMMADEMKKLTGGLNIPGLNLG